MTSATAPLRFFKRTYDEAFALLVEARDYLEHGAQHEQASLAPMGRLHATREVTRLTARLTGIMHWCLLQRAVHAGEIAAGEAARQAEATVGRAVCLRQGGAASGYPPRLADLLARSWRLYIRVTRLAEMTRRRTAG